jgi:cation diffusion facilitator CzcD-associated flavoprotein CzcO
VAQYGPGEHNAEAGVHALSSSIEEHPVCNVLIVGTGFGGICAAIQLIQAGEEDVILLERADRVGGTWRDNHYPGCACDVPSMLYSLSFAQNADWSRVYPTQPELQTYLEAVVRDYALGPSHSLRARGDPRRV